MVMKVISHYVVVLLILLTGACGSSESREPAQGSPPQAERGRADSAGVAVGAAVLLGEHLDELKGKRVGLVMNPTARVKGTHMLDTLMARDVNVTALFAPEHGFRGEAGAGETIRDGQDRATGLPVYSLYGDTRRPTAAMLQKVDLLLFDMQDVGARFYTYNVTMGRVLEAAADAEVPVWVLDRPNPAGGAYVAGWTLQQSYESFVGAYPIPMAHGMTMGELARMMVGERWLQTVAQPQLRVIPVRGWKRSEKWPATGLPWHPPSPNLPTFEHAYVYLGTVLFEGSTLSEGRGTDHPFLTLGSPRTDIPRALLDSLEARFEGIAIAPATFTPRAIPGKASSPKFEGQTCHGVRLQVTDYGAFEPVAFGVALLDLMLQYTPGARTTDFIYKLAGSSAVDALQPSWKADVRAFRKARQPYLLYD